MSKIALEFKTDGTSSLLRSGLVGTIIQFRPHNYLGYTDHAANCNQPDEHDGPILARRNLDIMPK